MKNSNSSVEMSQIVGGNMNPYINDDPDGEEEAENTEIAIWFYFNVLINSFGNFQQNSIIVD